MLNHVRYVETPVVVELYVVIVVGLAVVPDVKRLDHHHHTHLITEFDEFGCGHIVAGADRITAHILQHLNLVTQCVLVDSGAERTEVVVVAHALELTRLSVELEAVLGRKTDTAYARA